jgi:hypothetical protein
MSTGKPKKPKKTTTDPLQEPIASSMTSREVETAILKDFAGSVHRAPPTREERASTKPYSRPQSRAGSPTPTGPTQNPGEPLVVPPLPPPSSSTTPGPPLIESAFADFQRNLMLYYPDGFNAQEITRFKACCSQLVALVGNPLPTMPPRDSHMADLETPKPRRSAPPPRTAQTPRGQPAKSYAAAAASRPSNLRAKPVAPPLGPKCPSATTQCLTQGTKLNSVVLQSATQLKSTNELKAFIDCYGYMEMYTNGRTFYFCASYRFHSLSPISPV